MGQMCHLLKRNQQHVKEKRKQENRLMICSYKFKSKEEGQLGIGAITA